MARKQPEIQPETPDPIAALKSNSIHDRAAAARDLSKFGTPEHLDLLLKHAHNDKSPAVRLGTAAAASDILSRYRLPPASAELPLEKRRGLLSLFKGFDPAVNSGLFPILACLGLPELVERIAAGLRDPRGDVRLGGAVGLLRMVSSAAVAGDELMEARVVNLLSDRKMKPDALAAIAQVCAAVGYFSARGPMLALNLPGAHGEAVAEALRTLERLEEPLRGAWFSDGRDAGEVNPASPHGETFAIVNEDGALVLDPNGNWEWIPGFAEDGVRRLYFRRVGEPTPGPSFQRDGRTWYMSNVDKLREVLEELLESPPPGELAAQIALRLRPLLPEQPNLWRDVARLQLLAGDPAGALDSLNQAIEQKRTPADVWFYLGEALSALGRPDEAREAWEACLQKARSRKADYVRLAEERLGISGG